MFLIVKKTSEYIGCSDTIVKKCQTEEELKKYFMDVGFTSSMKVYKAEEVTISITVGSKEYEGQYAR